MAPAIAAASDAAFRTAKLRSAEVTRRRLGCATPAAMAWLLNRMPCTELWEPVAMAVYRHG